VLFRVLPLGLPLTDQLEALIGSEAGLLFLERARTVEPSFALGETAAAAIAQICRRLDGLPLAIELAAARVRVLPVEQLAGRLDDHLRLLVGGSRTAPPRHRTLRATLAWSHELLEAPAQVVFRRLAVFAGGCTLEALEKVASGNGVAVDEVLDLVAGLVDKLLVFVDAQGGAARYRLLETVRQYAAEQLNRAGELAFVHRRHLEWYLDVAERAAPELTRRDQLGWYERLAADYDNFRGALSWSQADPRGAEAHLRLAAALGRFWHFRGPMREGRAWLMAALVRSPSTPTMARATALNWAGSQP
jgi:predicted ATPase